MIEELSKICKIQTEVDLTLYNTFKLHGVAYAMCFVNDIKELISVLDILKKYKTKWFVIGNGSNIIIPDYYDGVIIKLSGFNKSILTDNILYVEANCMLNKIATKVTLQGYEGLDFACGIPGTIGGSIYGNAGCYGSDISKVLISAIIFDGKKIIELSNEELKFGYRDSILKNKQKYIVLSATFKLEKANKEQLKEKMLERNKKRRDSQPLNSPSNGSVFRNPAGFAAGKLIDDLGLKGTRINDAVISDKHANFIVNDGNATSGDIIKLIKLIKKEVKKAYNIDLILEQEIIK